MEIKAGRPTGPAKLTSEVQIKIIEALKIGNFMETAATMAKVSRQTIYNWLNRGRAALERMEAGEEIQDDEIIYLNFTQAAESAMAESESRNLSLIARAALGGDLRANFWFLERRFPQRWGKREQLQIDGKMENTNRREIIVEQQMSEDAESQELLKQLYRRQTAINSNTAAERNRTQLTIEYDL